MLDSVLNINEPLDYEQARARPAPTVVVQRFGVLASSGERGARRVEAATVAQAASAVGLTLDRHVVAAVNGDHIGRDGQLALVAGDTVSFICADAGG
jgi:molybdopterin-guanine dinucleotide biosynthesis protein A